MRSIPAILVAVAADLAADRRGNATEVRSDPADGCARREQVHDPDPLVL
jgi:hypothetical protein